MDAHTPHNFCTQSVWEPLYKKLLQRSPWLGTVEVGWRSLLKLISLVG
ncbi:hypothetical protein [Oscillatoria acuminata]|nr:hypothetical protein [Oscillatoria acuminata]